MVRSETRSAWLKNIATISYDPAPARSSVMPAPSAAKSESFPTPPPRPFKPKLCNEIDHLGAYSFSPTSRWATLQLCTRERTTSPLVSHLAIRFSNPRICNKICNEMKRLLSIRHVSPSWRGRRIIFSTTISHSPSPRISIWRYLWNQDGEGIHSLSPPLPLPPNHVQRNVFEFEQTGGSLGIRLGAHRSSRGIIQGGEASRRNPDERHFSYILHPSLC